MKLIITYINNDFRAITVDDIEVKNLEDVGKQISYWSNSEYQGAINVDPERHKHIILAVDPGRRIEIYNRPWVMEKSDDGLLKSLHGLNAIKEQHGKLSDDNQEFLDTYIKEARRRGLKVSI